MASSVYLHYIYFLFVFSAFLHMHFFNYILKYCYMMLIRTFCVFEMRGSFGILKSHFIVIEKLRLTKEPIIHDHSLIHWFSFIPIHAIIPRCHCHHLPLNLNKFHSFPFIADPTRDSHSMVSHSSIRCFGMWFWIFFVTYLLFQSSLLCFLYIYIYLFFSRISGYAFLFDCIFSIEADSNFL